MTKWMPQNLDKSIPMYRAIADAIAADVKTGVLHPGDQLPTHRDLADALGINVSTVTRAYKEAMYRGWINGTVGRGTFISADVITDLSMAASDSLSSSSPIEMGLVTGFYGLDPPVEKTISRLTGKRNLSAFLRYTPSDGLPEHKDVGAVWVGKYGLQAKPSQIVVFSGIQHGLSCCLMALFRPGDRVAVEQFTYPGIKTIAAMAGIHLVPVEMDAQGMIPGALDVACRRNNIKGVYVIPTVQNPTTVTMPQSRREQLADIITRHHLILLEDDAFALTVSDRPAPIGALIPENTIFFAGISKVVWPGLRVCFSAVPHRFYNRVIDAILNTIWMTPPLNVALVAELIQSGEVDDILDKKRNEARMRNILVKEKFRGFSYVGNPTGFFIWLKLKSPWTGQTFENAALAAGVRIFGSDKFAVGSIVDLPSAIRISLTGPETLYDIRKGLSILKQLLEENSPMPAGIL